MKALVVLFALNVAIAISIWFEVRQLPSDAIYDVGDRVLEVSLLKAENDSVPYCHLLGPFVDEAQLDEYLAGLGTVDALYEKIEQSIEKAPGYWVYFGPLKSYELALNQLREFQEKSIDSFIITKEELYGAISVGVFQNIDSARRMQEMMLRKGYPTSIRNIFKFETVWWLEIRLRDGAENNIKNSVLDVNSVLGFESREFFCKTVAS